METNSGDPDQTAPMNIKVTAFTVSKKFNNTVYCTGKH